MTKRLTTIILTCITVLATAVPLSACAPQPAETQEEFQAEFIEKMMHMGFYVHPDYESKFDNAEIVEVAEGVVIYEKKLEKYLHVYELYTGIRNTPTAEEVEGLYNKYDQVTYKKFHQFYDWYCNCGETAYDDYLDGISKALMDYKDKYGTDYKDIDSLSDYWVDDLIDFELYVIKNPDYSDTSHSYQRLLEWLTACAKPDESTQFKKEYQAEYVEILKEMGLFAYPQFAKNYSGNNIVTLDEDVQLLEDELIIKLHVYELTNEPKAKPPTLKEIEGLYTQYNDGIYKKFSSFYKWYHEVGCISFQTYSSALIRAKQIYKETYGKELINKENWDEFTAQDRIKIEGFVKEHPDFSEANDDYQRLLKWLGV